MTRLEKIYLAIILLVAAAVRLWGFRSYFPCFWDETKYIGEVEQIAPFFSVNAGAYAFLKSGYALIGGTAYPQIVASIFGVMTVLGIFLLGRRILRHKQSGIHLGLLMAGQAAVMPYLVRYSRHAFPAVFALCFFVYALYFYLGKLHYPLLKKSQDQFGYLRTGILAAGLLAWVPACSIKFLFPTLILFLIIEVFIWRVRSADAKEYRSLQNFAISVFTGAILLAATPLIVAMVSGYTGWFERALTLSRYHAEVQTLRVAYHFLYPVPLYYLAGPVFILCALLGPLILYYHPKTGERAVAGAQTNWLMVISCAVSLLFFGLFSHLQAARVYVLTLLLPMYASALFVLRLPRIRPRYGKIAARAVYALLIGSMGYLSLDYVSRSTPLPAACDTIMRQIRPNQAVWANATAQVAYGTYHSKFNLRKTPQEVTAFLRPNDRKLDPGNPPIIVIQDAADLVALMVAFDKYDLLEVNDIDDARWLLQDMQSTARQAQRFFSAADRFYTSPHYYLEELYSWKSFEYIHELMAEARDSVYVYAPGSP